MYRVSFLIRLQVFRIATLLKRDSNTGDSCNYCDIFKNSFFIEHLQWLLLNVTVVSSSLSSLSRSASASSITTAQWALAAVITTRVIVTQSFSDVIALVFMYVSLFFMANVEFFPDDHLPLLFSYASKVRHLDAHNGNFKTVQKQSSGDVL